MGCILTVSYELIPYQTQPPVARLMGLRYREVLKFVPANAWLVRCSTTSRLNICMGLRKCLEDVPLDNIVEANFTPERYVGSGRGFSVPIQKHSPVRGKGKKGGL